MFAVCSILKDFQMQILGFSQQMLLGAFVTIQVAVFAYFMALSIGVIAAALSVRRNSVFSYFWAVYTSIFTGVPSLLVAFFFYYAGSDIIASVTSLFGVEKRFDLTPFAAAILALGLVYGAYIADLVRSAIRNVSKGQFEAADVLQVKRFYTYSIIVTPQVARIALPGLTNMWIVVLKDTALISLIGLKEIMAYAKLASGVTKEPFVFFMIAALFFLLMTSLTYYAYKHAQNWADRGAPVYEKE